MLIPAPTFTHVAADVTGPFRVKFKKVPKVWILIYQCQVSKALHLELVDSYTGPSLIMALAKIIARRNHPSSIVTNAGRKFFKG